MQPRIAYAIHATLSLGYSRDGHSTILDERREIRLMPFSAVSPFLQIDRFPASSNSISGMPLKQNIWASSMGEMKISVDEPSPLNLCTIAPKATTECSIKLRLTPKKALATNIRPESWGCTVESRLHIKTYYSVRPLPKRLDLHLRGLQFRLRSEFTRAESRDFNSLSWRLDRLSRYGTIIEDPQPSWIGIVTLPINASKLLLPSFLSTFAARLYAIKVKVKLLGVRHDPFELEVPLQVVYNPLTSMHHLLHDLMEPSLVTRRNSVSTADILDSLVHVQEPQVRYAYLSVYKVSLIASIDCCNIAASL
jgi:hypothetical protein